MQLLTFSHQGQVRVGARYDDWVVDLNRAYRLLLVEQRDDDELAVADARLPADMLALLAGGEFSLDAARKAASFARKFMAADPVALKRQGAAYPVKKGRLAHIGPSDDGYNGFHDIEK